jgi:3-hydroxyacyl-[acyl-carrier-protein] dehydratase
LIVDFSEYDVDTVLVDADGVRAQNPQRYEMEQLTAIVFEDFARKRCVGYKDVTDHEFWMRGHMPDMPLMPGVIICEAAAQLSGYYTVKHDLLGTRMVGFGGLEAQFRGVVRPGDRLVIAVQMVKVRRGAMIISDFQAFVRQNLVANGTVKGIPLPVELLAATGKS